MIYEKVEDGGDQQMFFVEYQIKNNNCKLLY